MKTVRQFINGVLEAGNWDIRDAFDDIIARDAEHDADKAALANMIAKAGDLARKREVDLIEACAKAAHRYAIHISDVPGDNCACNQCQLSLAIQRDIRALRTIGGE